MNAYEVLLDHAYEDGCSVWEMPFTHHDGLILGDKIGIRRTIDTNAEKADTLAEELAHHDLTVGNILDQSITMNRKQEHKARAKAYDMRIGLERIVDAIDMGCKDAYEASAYLGVSERFFNEALGYYHEKYGECVEVGDRTLIFDPCIDLV